MESTDAIDAAREVLARIGERTLRANHTITPLEKLALMRGFEVQYQRLLASESECSRLSASLVAMTEERDALLVQLYEIRDSRRRKKRRAVTPPSEER